MPDPHPPAPASAPDVFGVATDGTRRPLPGPPEHWPDFLTVRPDRPVPAWVWAAPVPVVGRLPDPPADPDRARLLGPHCDFVLADPSPPGGDRPPPDGPRDLDLLVVVPADPWARLADVPWVLRAVALAGSCRVRVAGAADPDLPRLLGRTRVVVPRGAAVAQLTFEAIAAGAVPAVEAGTPGLDGVLDPGRQFAAFAPADFETVVAGLLADEPARRRMAGAARASLPDLTDEALWVRAVRAVRAGWAAVTERCAARTRRPPDWRLLLHDPDPPAAAVAALDPAAAAFVRGWATGDEAEFARVLDELPGFRPAALLRVEALAAADRPAEAAAQARAALELLDRGPLMPAEFDLPCARDGYWFRAAWAAAGAAGAGNRAAEAAAKTQLARWWLHALLAGLTEDLAHFHEAALARPDLPVARAALGCALARAGKLREAVPHLRAATAADPFDRPAARALHQVLLDLGDHPAARRLRRDQRVFAAVAPGLVPLEDWFAADGPVGDEPASIIVVCHNGAADTRACLESVFRHTRPPYELVLVDNGSTDDTAAVFEAAAARPEPARVHVVRLPANLGFPAGVNRGLAEAAGAYLVLLNNDTVVTPGWLDGLTDRAAADGPPVGLVGPVSNATRPPQRVQPGYADLGGLNAFARRRREEFRGRGLDVPRLTGFCLLVRRDVFEQVGGLDERFGPGFFDDDLSVRAARAGFRLVVALDTYVHHHGGRTFAALGLDTDRLLEDNLGRFREKWGDAEAAGYAPARPRVSLTMIVRDEEANLPDCLAGLRELFDEIVVVDTGSLDRTREAAAAHGARVVEFPWVDDFAAARNEGLRHATGEWVFWLDADDRLDPPARAALADLFRALPAGPAGFVMKCLCVSDRPGEAGTVVDHVRLFRADPRVRWEYRVHEQILPALRAVGADVRWADVTIRHVGYADPAVRARKLDRDLRLLRAELADRPGEPFVLFNLGSVYLEQRRPADALAALTESLVGSHPRDSIVRKLHALIAECHRDLGRPAAALAAVRTGRADYPDDAELLFLEGVLLREAGDLRGAAAAFERLLTTTEGDHFASVDAALRGEKARRMLETISMDMGTSSSR